MFRSRVRVHCPSQNIFLDLSLSIPLMVIDVSCCIIHHSWRLTRFSLMTEKYTYTCIKESLKLKIKPRGSNLLSNLTLISSFLHISNINCFPKSFFKVFYCMESLLHIECDSYQSQTSLLLYYGLCLLLYVWYFICIFLFIRIIS